MGVTPDIRSDIQDLQASKYNTPWEAVKGFFSGAAPSLITYSAIGAACGLALIGIGAMAGTLTGALVPALLLGGATALGGTIATVTGGAHAFKHTQEVRHRNKAIDHAVDTLAGKAQMMGQPVADIAPPDASSAERNAAKSAFLGNILDKGKQTFAPAEILKRAGDDVMTGLGRR